MIMLVCHGISMLNFKTVTPFKSGILRYLLSLTKPFTSLHGTPSVGGFPPLLAGPPAPVSGTGPGAWRPLRNYRMMISGKMGRKRTF